MGKEKMIMKEKLIYQLARAEETQRCLHSLVTLLECPS
jgi:hypothetical protein